MSTHNTLVVLDPGVLGSAEEGAQVRDHDGGTYNEQEKEDLVTPAPTGGFARNLDSHGRGKISAALTALQDTRRWWYTRQLRFRLPTSHGLPLAMFIPE